MMNRKTKKRMLVMSLMFLALGATVTLASSNDVLKVQTMLNSAIQDIQKIYFSSGAVKDLTHPEYEIPVLVQNGSVSMGGRMLMTTSGAKNILTKESTGSSLFQGRNNILSGVDSYILAGSGNRIYQNVTGSVIIGGTNNTINQGKNLYILGGSGNKIWQGNNSFIIGGKNVQITGDNSYVFMGNGTNQGESVKINANHVVTFGKNVEIDKDYVFLWRDHSTTDKKTAEKENTFIMFAKNGLHILKNNSTSKAVFVTTGALKVEGSVQLSGEEVKCGKSIQGAIQYTGGTNGCFCGCNGSSWVSLLPTENCRKLCPKISGRSYEDGKCIEVPNGGFESLYNDASSCSEGEISGYNQVNDPSGFPMRWTWECIGDNGTIASCSGDAKREEGKCFSGAGASGKGSEFTCFTGKPTNQQTNGHKYTWDCLPINKPTNYPNTPKQNRKSCAACDQENGYVRNSSIQDCVLAQDTSCDNTTQLGCTNSGNPVNTKTIEGGNTWDCESPTGGTGENGCHWCNGSSNYVWDGDTNTCVLKKKGECRTDFTGSPTFSTTSSADNNWCKVGKRIEYSPSGNTYKWKCEGENAGGDTAWNSDICYYCAGDTEWKEESGKCEDKENCTPTKTCSSYGYSDRSRYPDLTTIGCYSTKSPSDGCGGNLSCLQIGCPNIMGNTNFACYPDISHLSPRQGSTSLAVGGGYCADKTLEGGYYWKDDGYNTCNGSSSLQSCPNLTIIGGYSLNPNNDCSSYGNGAQCCYRFSNSRYTCTYATNQQIYNRNW